LRITSVACYNNTSASDIANQRARLTCTDVSPPAAAVTRRRAPLLLLLLLHTRIATGLSATIGREQPRLITLECCFIIIFASFVRHARGRVCVERFARRDQMVLACVGFAGFAA